MTNAKTTRKALLTSVVALMLCFTMLMGTTFAWFTDSVSSTGNIIKSGTLDVTMEWADGKEDPASVTWTDASTGAIFNHDKWEPGYTEVRHIKIANEGTLAFTYKVEIVATGTVSELADVIDVYYVDPAVQVADRTALSENAKLGTLADALTGMATTATGVLEAGKADTITIALKMQEDAGNEYQELSIGSDFAIVLLATQATVEKDSFDDQYDKDAEYPIAVTSAQGLKDAMLVRGANIVLSDDIVVDKDTPLQWGAYMFVANGREVTIDLNGNSITVTEDASIKCNGLFTTANGGTLNIIGDGTIEIKNGQSGIFHAMNKNDQINVYGGTYISNSDNGSDALAIIYTNSGNVDVYGGKFIPLEGVTVANAEDRQGDRLSIVFHEGTLMKYDMYYVGYDATRIQLEEGCTLEQIAIDGETWYQVTKTTP